MPSRLDYTIYVEKNKLNTDEFYHHKTKASATLFTEYISYQDAGDYFSYLTSLNGCFIVLGAMSFHSPFKTFNPLPFHRFKWDRLNLSVYAEVNGEMKMKPCLSYHLSSERGYQSAHFHILSVIDLKP